MLLAGCSSLKYSTAVLEDSPELITIGEFKKYATDSYANPKGMITLSSPLRLKTQKIVLKKRSLFSNDSLRNIQQDSVLISFEILDKFALIEQMKTSQTTSAFLKQNPKESIVTKISMSLPEYLQQRVMECDEVYLIQNQRNSHSITLYKNNTLIETISFADGAIVNFETSSFCWGQNKKRRIEIFDLVDKRHTCDGGLYKSANKAKKAHELSF